LQEYNKFLGLKKVYGLELETKEGVYTGNITTNPGISLEKSKLVNEIIGSHNENIILALGDSLSDIPLFQAAPINVVVNNATLNVTGHELHITGEITTEKILRIIKKEICKRN